MQWRSYGYAVIALIVGAVALPLSWPAGRDSFPLSSYPMFSRDRPTPDMTIQYAVGVEADGTRRQLAPEFIGNDEVLQAPAVLRRALRSGSLATDQLCRAIAARVAEPVAVGLIHRVLGADFSTIVEVRIVTGTHDAVEYLTGRDRVGRERVHVACPVPGRARSNAEAAP